MTSSSTDARTPTDDSGPLPGRLPGTARLPPAVRKAFDWAIRELERAPKQLPQLLDYRLETEALERALRLFRIAVRVAPPHPGHHAIFSVERSKVLFVRFGRQHATADKALRRCRSVCPSEARSPVGRR